MSLQPLTLYRSPAGTIAQRGEDCFLLSSVTFDEVFTRADAATWLEHQLSYGKQVERPAELLPPIQSQEVWAAGVTYLRSRDARMEESKDGGTVYDRVYAAERPEIFFKATPHRVVGQDGAVRIRSDSKWNVPEPEVVLAINRDGAIFGYTIGNDMSSRDIEGENPLYLPQAKVYTQCCGLGPGLVVRSPLPIDTEIRLIITRDNCNAFRGATSLTQMKRSFPELASWLTRDNDFPSGCYLEMPPNEFTLAAGDEIAISVTGLGTLRNVVA
jgi:2-dehydro-3-deoxy-D-arabinonate dehydratase